MSSNDAHNSEGNLYSFFSQSFESQNTQNNPNSQNSKFETTFIPNSQPTFYPNSQPPFSTYSQISSSQMSFPYNNPISPQRPGHFTNFMNNIAREHSSQSPPSSISTTRLTSQVDVVDVDEVEEPNEEEIITGSTSTKKSGGNVWTKEEDSLLISAWLNTSMNIFIGTNQKTETFWAKIAAYMAKYQAEGDQRMQSPVQRTWVMCKARWNNKISPGVTKFGAFFDKSVERNQSGWNEADHIKAAHIMYKAILKKTCSVEHCWRELRNEEKWRTQVKPPMNEDGQPVIEMPRRGRPLGKCATKSKGKSKLGSSSTDVSVEAQDRVENMKQRQIERNYFLMRMSDVKELEITVRQQEMETRNSQYKRDAKMKEMEMILRQQEMSMRNSQYQRDAEMKEMETTLRLGEYEKSITEAVLSGKTESQIEWYEYERSAINARKNRS